MSVINTNINSLTAQASVRTAGLNLSTAMERLSSGIRINSAKDDAAGLAISSRMDSQIRGLNMAIRNANDGISLMQTTEGSLGEVTSMLQRMRELAAQSVNGTNNESDRFALDAEVQQLKVEIDRIATTTEFNSQKLLDGSFKDKQFQIGDKAGASIDVSIASIKTQDLGLGGGNGVGNTLVSQRIAIADIDAGDILINGQAIGEIDFTTDVDDMEDVLAAINDNVDNVKASGFNVVVAQQKGNGVTTVGQFDITVKELGQTTATVFNISASNSMEELVANINAEAGAVVKAEINTDGKLQLSNQTGATITIVDGSAAAGDYDGGSGFSGTSTAFAGFLKLESLDGSAVRIERGNTGLVEPGDSDDLKALGFRETTRATLGDAYTTTGIALTSAGIGDSWGRTDIKINGVEIYDENIDSDSFEGKLATINASSSLTGVNASAFLETVIDTTDTWDGDAAADYEVTDKIWLNGTAVALGASLSAFVTNVNALTTTTGIVAEAQGNNLVLTGSNIQTLTVQSSATGGQDTAQVGTNIYLGLPNVAASNDETYYAAIRLDSTNNQPITIELGEDADDDEHGLLEMNVGAADFEVNGTSLGGLAGKAISGLNVATQEAANEAITIVDIALDNVSAMRSELGAVQNRLEHTINNLTNVATNTSAAKSRITDTDYAVETSNLAKAQIISQAATAMLAQANQSGQNVLALLK
jgi:flagellin